MNWYTRDSGPNRVLSHKVDEWSERPVRHSDGNGGYFWLGPEGSGISHRTRTMMVNVARAEIGVVPDTDIECIVVV